MAVTVGQVVKRKGRDGKLGWSPVATTKVLYEGTLCFRDASGYATDVKVDGSTVFLGVVRSTVDNTSGANGDKKVEFWRDGEFYLPCSSLAITDVGSAIYATDNFTTTKTSSTNPAIGKLTEYVSATVGVVEIRGVGEA